MSPAEAQEVREEYGVVITVRDGLIVRQENFRDWRTALAALKES